MQRRYYFGIAGASLLLLLCAGLVWYSVRSEQAMQWLWQIAQRASQGRLSGTLDSGTLAGGVHLRDLTYQSDGLRVTIDRLDSQWTWTSQPLTLSIDELHVGEMDVYSGSQPTSAQLQLPQELTLPLAITLNQTSIQKLTLHRDSFNVEFRELSLSGESNGAQHALDLKSVTLNAGVAHGSLHLNGKHPFVLGGDLTFAGLHQEEQYRIESHLSGSLVALNLKLHTSGDRLNGDAYIESTPFDSVPLQRVQISLQHVDPQWFDADAPHADLAVHATLTPLPNATQLTVSGPVKIVNARPGPIDQGRIPLTSINAQVWLDAQVSRLSQVSLQFSHGASAIGQGQIDYRGHGEFAMQARAIDLHALYSKLKPSGFDGPISVKLTPGTQHVVIALADATRQLEAEATINAQAVELQQASLEVSSSRLELSGTLQRNAQRGYAFTGKLVDFNPALWIESSSAHIQSIAGQINASFQASGEVMPQLAVNLKFELGKSHYGGSPLTGGGVIHLLGKRLLPSDAQLSIAGNRFLLRGSFGTPLDRVEMRIDAANLSKLGFGLSGSLRVNAQVGGSLDRLRGHADYSARNLVLGEHRLSGLSGQLDIDTPLDRTRLLADANALGVINVKNYQGPIASINRLALRLDGTSVQHQLSVDADGQLGGQALELKLNAQGGLEQALENYSWRGVIQTLENRGSPRFALDAPVSASFSARHLALGNTRMTFEQATIDLQHFSFDHGRIRSAGTLTSLDVGHLLAWQQSLTGAALPLDTNLVLDGRWDFNLAEQAAGFLEVGRLGGDVTVKGAQGPVPLGLSQVALRADFQDDRIRVAAQAQAARLGSFAAQGWILLERQRGVMTLAPNAPLSGTLTATLPELRQAGAFIGPGVLLNGSAALNLNVAGTLSNPSWSGTVVGNQMELTQFDTGIQLRDGSMRIVLNENSVELQQFLFHGIQGTLSAEGRVQLGRSNQNLGAVIVADHLQLFADPDRSLMLSGQASLTYRDDKLRIEGNVLVDHAVLDLPKSRAPKLGSDVVIVRGGEGSQVEAGAPTDGLENVGEMQAPRFAPIIDLRVNLGRDFRFKNADADLLLRGSMHLYSEPGRPLQATGTVRITEGTYEIYGRKLDIERGLINFHGPLNNPDINLIAMRRNQEVEAGVHVTGPANRPRVTLISEPNVGDEEKLSWLMFGRGSTDAAFGQQQAIGAALSTLLGREEGRRLIQGLGLDEFSIGASESGLEGQQVVNLGKAISDNFYFGYEQSLSGAASVVKIIWQWTQHWSVVARAGAITSVDVFYGRRFDKIMGDKDSRRAASQQP